MPIVNLNVTGPAPTTGTKSKASSKSAANAQSHSTSKATHKRGAAAAAAAAGSGAGGRDETGGATAAALQQPSSCQKCGRRDAKTRRLSASTTTTTAPSPALTVAVAQQEGIVGIHLCQTCRGVLDELMPPSQSAEDEEEPPWKPERRHLRILRNVLPERNTDLLVRHFRALQEVGQREREQAHLRAGGGGGGNSGNNSNSAGALAPPPGVAPPLLLNLTTGGAAATVPPPAAGYAGYTPLVGSTVAPSV
ncbi:hypothetical protein HDU89_006072 [Geranomyces variabilis]|nr:hypothetical protein HDU89_006072 [Geranomyces variabilis]